MFTAKKVDIEIHHNNTHTIQHTNMKKRERFNGLSIFSTFYFWLCITTDFWRFVAVCCLFSQLLLLLLLFATTRTTTTCNWQLKAAAPRSIFRAIAARANLFIAATPTTTREKHNESALSLQHIQRDCSLQRTQRERERERALGIDRERKRVGEGQR